MSRVSFCYKKTTNSSGGVVRQVEFVLDAGYDIHDFQYSVSFTSNSVNATVLSKPHLRQQGDQRAFTSVTPPENNPTNTIVFSSEPTASEPTASEPAASGPATPSV